MIKKRTTKEIVQKYNILKILLSLAISISIIIVVVFLISDTPVEAIYRLFLGPLDSKRHFMNILENSIPFLFTGTAVCLIFSAGDITLSGEGAVYFGGFVSALVVLNLSLPPTISMLFAFLAALVSGAIIAVIPIYLNKRFKINAFIFSLLFNFVLLYFGNYILNYVMKDVNYVGIASEAFPAGTTLTSLAANTKLNVGLFVGIAVSLLAWFFLYKTTWGYKARMVGTNSSFAKTVGVNSMRISMLVALLGGGVSALGGAFEILGKNPRFTWAALPGYGWDGFMVATLALQNPLYVPLAAFFLGYLRTGAQIMNLYTDIPMELISVIQSIIILFIASKSLLKK